ncbi:MAG TPA: LuxR C-terminal-related transcriptional regulator [Solirubrobacteraceae bacterium]|nr:LuxR C-terminal-related transcriptional regulator [Solirubrobacteraceae bacterium]
MERQFDPRGAYDPRAAATALTATQLALLPEAIPHLVWTARGDGTVQYVNHRGRELLALSEQTGVAQERWSATVHPEDEDRVRAVWQAAVMAGGPFRCVYRVRRRDEAYLPVLALANPVLGTDGEIVMWAGTLTDLAGLSLDPAGAPVDLTARELELLRLAADGASGPEMAERLGVRPATVKRHFENVYAKLGVRDRTAAVAYALRHGLIA